MSGEYSSKQVEFELPHDGIICGIDVTDDIQDLFEVLPMDSQKGPYEVIGELEKTVRGMKIRKAPRKVSIMYNEEGGYVIFELTNYMKLQKNEEENNDDIDKYLVEYSASIYKA